MAGLAWYCCWLAWSRSAWDVVRYAALHQNAAALRRATLAYNSNHRFFACDVDGLGRRPTAQRQWPHYYLLDKPHSFRTAFRPGTDLISLLFILLLFLLKNQMGIKIWQECSSSNAHRLMASTFRFDVTLSIDVDHDVRHMEHRLAAIVAILSTFLIHSWLSKFRRCMHSLARQGRLAR